MLKPEARYFYIKKTGGLTQVPSLRGALAGAGKDGYIWLDYCDPTAKLLAELSLEFGIHPLSIEDCINEHQLPKLDLFPKYSFLVFNIFEPSSEEVFTHELDLFISSNYLITAGFRDQAGRQLLQGLEQVIEREMAMVQLGPSFLLHQVIDIVVDGKFEAIETIEERLDADEDLILSKSESFNLASLMNSRKDLLVIRKALFYERELVGKLIRKDSPYLAEQSLVYFRDVYDHLSKYYEMSDSARDQVTSLMEIRLSMVSNQMAQSANRTNKIMRRLTLITTIFMPLTLISGIGGMSEFTMMVGVEHWKTGYLVLLIVMAVIATINYILLQRMEKQLPQEDSE